MCAMADLVLVEADGSRRLPLKVPRPGEPVLPENADMILCIAGLSSAGAAASEKCFRLERSMKVMEAHGRQGFMKDGGWTIHPEDIGCLMHYGYMEPMRTLCPGIPVIPVLNQADTPELAKMAWAILDNMGETQGIATGGLLEEPSAKLF